MASKAPHLTVAGAGGKAQTRLLSRGTDGGVIRRTVLPGGLRVMTESMPGVHSATFGVWVGVGSRDETTPLAGASHFLEHLLFKGTQRRSALEIAAVMDAVGGEMNAFTAKESTCFYAHVLDSDLPLAVDVVCDGTIVHDGAHDPVGMASRTGARRRGIGHTHPYAAEPEHGRDDKDHEPVHLYDCRPYPGRP